MAKSKKSYHIPSKVGLCRGDKGEAVKDLQLFLDHFGYLKRQRTESDPYSFIQSVSNPPEAEANLFDTATFEALKTYQQFYGLPDTGVLDDATIAQMSIPRCGFPDIPHDSGVAEEKEA